jgi:hypothetical protein
MPRLITVSLPDGFDDVIRTHVYQSTGKVYDRPITDEAVREFVGGVLAAFVGVNPHHKQAAAEVLASNMTEASKASAS